MKYAAGVVVFVGMLAILFIASIAWMQVQIDNMEAGVCEAQGAMPFRTRNGVICLKKIGG